MAQASASDSLLADATRAARLRFWIVDRRRAGHRRVRGHRPLTIPGARTTTSSPRTTANSAIWRRRSRSRPRTPCRPPISCCATRSLGTRPSALRPELPRTTSWRLRAAGLPQVREVRIIDEHGIPRFRSRELPADTSSLSDRAYFIAHRDHPHLGVVLSDPLITQIEHRPAVVMSRRLEKRDGSFDGIVQAVVDLEAFQRVYQAIDLGQGSAINLLRDDGTLVVRQPQAPQAVRRQISRAHRGGFRRPTASC